MKPETVIIVGHLDSMQRERIRNFCALHSIGLEFIAGPRAEGVKLSVNGIAELVNMPMIKLKDMPRDNPKGWYQRFNREGQKRFRR